MLFLNSFCTSLFPLLFCALFSFFVRCTSSHAQFNAVKFGLGGSSSVECISSSSLFLPQYDSTTYARYYQTYLDMTLFDAIVHQDRFYWLHWRDVRDTLSKEWWNETQWLRKLSRARPLARMYSLINDESKAQPLKRYLFLKIFFRLYNPSLPRSHPISRLKRRYQDVALCFLYIVGSARIDLWRVVQRYPRQWRLEIISEGFNSMTGSVVVCWMLAQRCHLLGT